MRRVRVMIRAVAISEAMQRRLEAECSVEFFVAGGPGGQHRNRNATGVRLVHEETGITVTATERRSRTRNLEAAWERMAARIIEHERPRKKRIPTRMSRSAKRRRLLAKRRRGELKQSRGKVKHDG